jgi:hypothetical protein
MVSEVSLQNLIPMPSRWGVATKAIRVPLEFLEDIYALVEEKVAQLKEACASAVQAEVVQEVVQELGQVEPVPNEVDLLAIHEQEKQSKTRQQAKLERRKAAAKKNAAVTFTDVRIETNDEIIEDAKYRYSLKLATDKHQEMVEFLAKIEKESGKEKRNSYIQQLMYFPWLSHLSDGLDWQWHTCDGIPLKEECEKYFDNWILTTEFMQDEMDFVNLITELLQTYNEASLAIDAYILDWKGTDKELIKQLDRFRKQYY